MAKRSSETTIIQPRKGLIPIDFRELFRRRELLWVLGRRDIKVRYKQTVFGILWAILQPFMTMIVFTFFFGNLAKIPSEGVPYALFSYSGLVLWTFFTNAVNVAGNSMVNDAGLISKVYFPRVLIPFASTLLPLLDYVIALVIVFGIMVHYHTPLNPQIAFLPVVVFLTWILVCGIGLWSSAINVKYRDVRYAIPIFLQLMIFMTPVIYPISISGRFKWLVMLNPMTGLMEAHRACILGHHAIDFRLLGISVALTALIFVSGMFYFRSVERFFSDII